MVTNFTYSFCGLDDGVASRVSKDWAEEREKESVNFEKVIEPTENEFNLMAESTLPFINLILHLESQGKLPSNIQANQLLELDDTAYLWPHTIPEKNGARKLLIVPEQNDPNQQQDAPRRRTTEQEYDTFYDANHAIIDRPLHEDLANDKTAEKLMNYSLEVVNRALLDENKPNNWQDFPDKDKPIMKHIGAPLLGDGNPTHAMNKITRQNPEMFQGKIHALFGGFHSMLEGHKKRGSLFGPTHLAPFFSCWRPTQGQLDWVLKPGDPNQINGELTMYHCAMYTMAIRGLIKAKADETNTPNDIVQISPTDVVDFMLERAKTYPIIMCILIELRLAEVIFMLHESEKLSNSKLYVAAIKFLLPLFASTHATKYVSMCIDFLVKWFCESDAFRIIFEKALLTRKTKNGKNIFADRSVEWMIRDFRTWLGKHTSPHHDSLIEEVAMTMNERKKIKIEGSSKTKKRKIPSRDLAATEEDDDPEVKDLPVDRIFCEVVAYCNGTNLWGPGKVRYVKPGPFLERCKRSASSRTRQTHQEDDIFNQQLKSLEGKPMNNDVLFSLSLGWERCKNYFLTFLKNGDLNDPSRPETKKDTNVERFVSLRAIDPTVADEHHQKLQEEIQRVKEMEGNKLDGLYTASELKTELNYLNSELESRNMEKEKRNPRFFQSDSKQSKIFLVTTARMRLLEVDQNFTKRRIEELNAVYNDLNTQRRSTFQLQIEKELENRFLTLRGTACYDKYAASKYDFDVSSGQNRTEVDQEEGDSTFSSPSAFSVGLNIDDFDEDGNIKLIFV